VSDIPTWPLEPVTIVGCDADLGAQREAVDVAAPFTGTRARVQIAALQPEGARSTMITGASKRNCTSASPIDDRREFDTNLVGFSTMAIIHAP